MRYNLYIIFFKYKIKIKKIMKKNIDSLLVIEFLKYINLYSKNKKKNGLEFFYFKHQ